MANYTSYSLVKGNSFKDTSTVCAPSKSSEVLLEEEHNLFQTCSSRDGMIHHKEKSYSLSAVQPQPFLGDKQ